VDALIVESKLTLDFEKRRTINRKLHAILADEQPYTFLWTLTNYSAYHRKCGGCRSIRTSSSRSPTSGSFRRASRSEVEVRIAAARPGGGRGEALGDPAVARVLRRELAVTALLLLGVSVVVFAVLYAAPATRSTCCSKGSRPARSSPRARR